MRKKSVTNPVEIEARLPEIINFLVSVGKPGTMHPSTSMIAWDEYWATCKLLEEKIKSGEITRTTSVFLIKGLALLEMTGIIGPLGSTTQVHNLLSALSRRKRQKLDSAAYDDLEDWLFGHRNNPYVPTGGSVSLDVKSLADYEQYLQRGAERRQMREEERQLQHRLAQEKKTAKHAEHLRHAAEKRTARSALEKALVQLSSRERLELIANDDRHTINLYPTRFSEVKDSELSLLPPKIIKALNTKLEESKKGPWRELRKRLSKYLSANL